MNALDLSALCGLGLDETASKRGRDYVTVFLDMEEKSVRLSSLSRQFVCNRIKNLVIC
jgi:hypothetical protein